MPRENVIGAKKNPVSVVAKDIGRAVRMHGGGRIVALCVECNRSPWSKRTFCRRNVSLAADVKNKIRSVTRTNRRSVMRFSL